MDSFDARAWNEFFAREAREAELYLESMPALIAHSPGFAIVQTQHLAKRYVADRLCGQITTHESALALLRAVAAERPSPLPEGAPEAEFTRWVREYARGYLRRIKGEAWG